jgi:hypothetical protein
LVLSVAIASLRAELWGYTYPGGRPFQVSFDPDFERTKQRWIGTWGQFADTYWHEKIIFAGVVFFLAAVWTALASLVQKMAIDARLQKLARDVLFVAPSLAVLSFGLLVVGFGQDVYPNIRYNLGGGQPDIAVLHVGSEDSAVEALPIVRMANAKVRLLVRLNRQQR